MRQQPSFNFLDFQKENYINFAINQKLLSINTVYLARILSKSEDKENTYDIQPLQNIVNNDLDSIPQPIIKNAPSMSLMGGSAGVVIEYDVDDVVLVATCQREIFTKEKDDFSSDIYDPSNKRMFSISDSIILNKMTYSEPLTRIKITKDSIDINSNEGDVNITAKNININVEDNMNFGEGSLGVVLSNAQIEVSGVQPGSGTAIGTIKNGVATKLKAK